MGSSQRSAGCSHATDFDATLNIDNEKSNSFSIATDACERRLVELKHFEPAFQKGSSGVDSVKKHGEAPLIASDIQPTLKLVCSCSLRWRGFKGYRGRTATDVLLCRRYSASSVMKVGREE